jgi:CRISPR-associated protein Cas5d
MNNPIYLRAWGDLACFTRPEMKVERVSYPVITPSAARGLLEAILYKPQFRWCIQRIAVRRPIQFLAFRRNEVKSKASRNPEPIFADEDRTQRNTLALRHVDYVIEASLVLTPLASLPRLSPHGTDEPIGDDNLGKYYGMARRRIEQGQCFYQPCFGCREFPAHFEATTASAMHAPHGLNADADLGLMLYDVFDLDISNQWQAGKIEASPQITFFRASLKDGIVEVPPWSEMRKQLGGTA